MTQFILEQFKKFAQSRYQGEQIPIGVDMITGSLAGGIAGAITTPLDVMKTLLQTQQTSSAKTPVKKKHSTTSQAPSSTSTTNTVGSAATTTVPTKAAIEAAQAQTPVKHYSGIIDGMVWNYKNQGMAGLFRGLGPRVFWTSLQSAIMFVVYEQVLHFQADLREKDEWPPTKVAEKFV